MHLDSLQELIIYFLKRFGFFDLDLSFHVFFESGLEVMFVLTKFIFTFVEFFLLHFLQSFLDFLVLWSGIILLIVKIVKMVLLFSLSLFEFFDVILDSLR